jgi:hypothetical protein
MISLKKILNKEPQSINEVTLQKGKTYGGTKCEGGCFMGKEGLKKIIKISKDSPKDVFMFRDDNYSGLQPHFVKDGVIAKATVLNPAYDLEKHKVRNLNIGKDVILSVRLFVSTKESVTEAAMNPVKKVVNAILKKYGVNAMKTTSTSVKGFHNIQNGGYRYDSDYFLSFYKVPQDIVKKVGAELEKAGVRGVEVKNGMISADFSKTGMVKRESVKEAKSDYEVYHKSYTSAIQAAKAYAEKKGYEINNDDAFTKIGMGPRKPSEGKTNKFSIELSKDGKVQRKKLQIQVYGMRNSYELNAYIQ